MPSLPSSPTIEFTSIDPVQIAFLTQWLFNRSAVAQALNI
jgi:hypothetical protein